MPKEKRLVPKKFKLEYLREIDRNLILHCMQPNDTAEGYAHYSIYHAPSTLIARMVYTLESIIKHYKQAFKLRVKVERKVHGKKGIYREMAEVTETINAISGTWSANGMSEVRGALNALQIINKQLKGKN